MKSKNTEKPDSNLLDSITNPSDLKTLTTDQLKQLSDELREKTITAVSNTGGHLGAGLGVIELTVALHYTFNTPKDLIIWDVGHQTYPHKILTERKDRIHTLRQPGGLSGFTKRKESKYDPFGAGHSSTSISAALGMATARDMLNQDHEVLAVIGDGAMSAGMAYEAMNNAGASGKRLIVILNDNDMSIAPAVGAMSAYLSRLISSGPYLTLRNVAKNIASHLPKPLENAAKKTEQYAKNLTSGGNLFEEMGFYYVGPLDGHNLSHLLPVLKNIRDDKTIDRPILIHAITEKGKGFESPDNSKEKYHAVSKFDITTKKQKKTISSTPTYTEHFSNILIQLATQDPNIVAITAAMPSGTGLDSFAEKFKDRTYDVGIAEQHAVTFAAGLAAEGLKPFVTIYSTFLQRAYDQIVHDVAIQNLPVRFAIDRAGLVGADGPTHAGSFDIAFLSNLPNFVIMAPSDEQELQDMLTTATNINNAPSAIRYPRGESTGLALKNTGNTLEIGKGRIIQEGTDIALLSLGTRLNETKKAAALLEEQNISTTVADARFAKPIDTQLINTLAKNHKAILTIEEGATGGFGSHVLQHLTDNNLLNETLKAKALCLPDYFIEHNSPYNMYQEAGLNAEQIAEQATKLLNNNTQPHLAAVKQAS